MKLENGGGSQNVKPSCVTCGKRHYVECLLGTRSFYFCGKEGHTMRYCPNIASRGREGKKVVSSSTKDDALTKRNFYALRTSGSNPDENDDGDESKYFHFFLAI